MGDALRVTKLPQLDPPWVDEQVDAALEAMDREALIYAIKAYRRVAEVLQHDLGVCKRLLGALGIEMTEVVIPKEGTDGQYLARK